MDWDDEFNEEYDDAISYGDTDITNEIDGGDQSGGIDPLDITDPKSAYFFLSDDAQDEIERKRIRKMRCISCGHQFIGEIYDRCPDCFSTHIEEILL